VHMTAEDERFPAGRLRSEGALSPGRRSELIGEIAELPRLLRAALIGMTNEEWQTPYREGGWTVRQVVHHLADSHMNAFVRFRLGLTEETPVIKPYMEARWAELPDIGISNPELSVDLLEALHSRWVDLLRATPDADFARQIHHPEHDRRQSLDELLGVYAWHGRHHLAHIGNARDRAGVR